MNKSNSIVIFLIAILVLVTVTSLVLVYTFNNKIKEQNQKIEKLESDNLEYKTNLDNIMKSKSDDKNSNEQNLVNNEVSSTNKTSTEDVIKELFLEKLKQSSNNTEKLLDYRVDKVEILSKKSSYDAKYNVTDVLASITYSVKPKNVNSSMWTAGNGKLQGEWIINKISCECLRDGKLLDDKNFNTGW